MIMRNGYEAARPPEERSRLVRVLAPSPSRLQSVRWRRNQGENEAFDRTRMSWERSSARTSSVGWPVSCSMCVALNPTS